MGIYYALLDTKHKKAIYLPKAAEIYVAVRDDAPFDASLYDTKKGKAFDISNYWSRESFEKIVKFCEDADWNVEVVSDEGGSTDPKIDWDDVRLFARDEWEWFEFDERGEISPEERS